MTSYITHRVVSSHQLHETARATCIGISVLTKVRQAEITESDPGHDNFTNTEEEKQKGIKLTEDELS